MKQRWPARVIVAAFACFTVVIVHTVMTVLHVSPINPITVDLAPAISAYTQPFFRQNWQLFAPNPVSQENGLLVRALVENDDGSETITDYFDLTSPIINSIHSTRLFPPRRTRLGTSIHQLLAFRDPLAERLRQVQFSENSESEEAFKDNTLDRLPLMPAEKETHELAVHLLRKLATEAVREQWGENVTHIQVRFVTHDPPPFSQRKSSEQIGEITTTDSEWMTIIDLK